MKKIDMIIQFSEKSNCSDIHITAGSGIVGRHYGVLRRLENPYSEEELNEIILSMISNEAFEKLYSGKRFGFRLSV